MVFCLHSILCTKFLSLMLRNNPEGIGEVNVLTVASKTSRATERLVDSDSERALALRRSKTR